MCAFTMRDCEFLLVTTPRHTTLEPRSVILAVNLPQKAFVAEKPAHGGNMTFQLAKDKKSCEE